MRFPETKFFGLSKASPEAFTFLNHSSIFNEVVLCLDEKQGMLINDKYSSWHNTVGGFLMSVWTRKRGILCDNGPAGRSFKAT